MVKDPWLAVERVVLSEAAEIVAAREKCSILHGSSNIDAAGDEVEMCVRNLLRRKLGHNFYVGHGHIIDADWNASPQYDVVITDASVAPSIFRSENGTEYFPYETVYAIGEVKATFWKDKNPIAHFVETRRKINKLKRADVPQNYIRGLSGGFYFDNGIVSSNRDGKQNNLFSFMLFAGSGDFTVEENVDLFSNTSAGELPNVTCILDKGLIVYAHFDQLQSDGSYKGMSLLSNPARPVGGDGRTFA